MFASGAGLVLGVSCLNTEDKGLWAPFHPEIQGRRLHVALLLLLMGGL